MILRYKYVYQYSKSGVTFLLSVLNLLGVIPNNLLQ